MNKASYKTFLFLIIILLILQIVRANVYQTETDWDAKKNQPGTLSYALSQIKEMKDHGVSRIEVARRITSMADIQIINQNDLERMTVLDNWQFWGNPMQRNQDAWDKWIKDNGADEQYDVQAQWVYKNRFGQCAENSALTYYLLKEAGFEGQIRLFAAPDHAYTVWGMDPEVNPQDESSWTDDVIVLDAWSGKILTGKDAYHDGYIKGSQTVDGTDLRDNSAVPRCGFFATKNTASPCCKTISSCRDNPRLVCYQDKCMPCGARGYNCCQNDVCNFDTLECVNHMCVDKKTTTSTSISTTSTSKSSTTSKISTATINNQYKPVDCPTKIPDDSKWYDAKYFGLYRQGYGNPNWIGELQWFYDEAKTKWAQRLCYDENNKKQGTHYFWRENGQIQKTVEYKDDKQDGMTIEYYENGQIHYEKGWQNGVFHGIDNSYQEDGKPLSKYNYVNGKQDGTQTKYHMNGQISEQYESENGVSTGNNVKYYDDGRKLSESVGSMINGKFTGYTIRYDIGGVKCEYVNGEYVLDENGKGKCYYI